MPRIAQVKAYAKKAEFLFESGDGSKVSVTVDVLGVVDGPNYALDWMQEHQLVEVGADGALRLTNRVGRNLDPVLDQLRGFVPVEVA